MTESMCFDVNGYLPNGLRVFVKNIPLTTVEYAVELMTSITNQMIADGFAMSDPRMAALAAGEERDSVGYVLRKDKKNNDGSISSVIGLYPANEKAIKKYLWVYLDTQEDIDAFENATGIKLISMPVWKSKQAPDRDEDAAEYFTKVKDGVFAVYKANPDKTDDEKDKFVAARIFVRWESDTPTPPAAAAPAPSTATGEAAVSVGDDWEANERRKAVTALNNEMITIFKVRYQPTQNGVGVERWIATANVLGGGSVPVVVYGEDAGRITKAGYAWPKTDGDNLSIPVITEMRGSDRRITHVEPLERQPEQKERTWDGDAWKAVVEYAAAFEEEAALILGVDRGSKWKRGYNAAIKAIDTYIANRAANIDFMAEMPQASGL